MCICVHFLFFQVTYRSYADSQLLSGWTPHSAQKPHLCKKAVLRNSTPQHTVDLKGLNSLPHAQQLKSS